MARLPQPGSDIGTWGNVLNDYLSQAHKTDGTIKDSSITSSHLVTGAITGSSLENASINAAKLADNSVTPSKLSTSNTPSSGEVLSYNGSSLTWAAASGGTSDPTMGGDLTGTASNAQIAVGTVGNTELANNAVTTAKIADTNVTTGKLANNAVDSTKLANNSVTTTKLSTGVAPTNGQILSYNGTGLEWSTPGGVPTTLDDLSDVTTSGATNGQSLVYQSGNWTPATVSSGSGVTDHGALTGLPDDDHPQYLNNARGDARYYTQTQVDADLATKVDTTDSRLSDNRTPSDTSVSTAKIQDSAVTEPKLAVSNAPANGNVLSWNGTSLTWTAASSSNPTLGGDLSGTASSAQIATGVIVNADVNASAAIAQSKIANLTTDLSNKASASSSLAFIMYSGGAYPNRTTVTSDNNRVVVWIGPSAPTIGGNGAVNNVDIWWETS